MPSIGSKWPKDAPLWDYQAMCDYCGVQYRRSELGGPDRSGNLSCVATCRDYEGRDVVSLSEANARGVDEYRYDTAIRRQGNYDNDTGETPTPHRTDAEDIYS